MNIEWPSNTTEVINAIRGAIGRDILIYNKYDLGPCPICSTDSLLGNTYNPFCTTCSGTGVLSVFSGTTVSAHVFYPHGVETNYVTQAGEIDMSDCRATIEFSDEILQKVELSSRFVVDDEDLYLKDYELRGVPTPNRIVCYLQEDPREGR